MIICYILCIKLKVCTASLVTLVGGKRHPGYWVMYSIHIILVIIIFSKSYVLLDYSIYSCFPIFLKIEIFVAKLQYESRLNTLKSYCKVRYLVECLGIVHSYWSFIALLILS